MKPIIAKKAKEVEVIAQKLENSQTTVFVDYCGLTVKQMTALRKEMREAGLLFKVYKNSLVVRACAQLSILEMDEILSGPNAVAFSENDPVLPAKILGDFAKDNNALEIKAGIVNGKKVSSDVIQELAKLPSREGLLSMLLSVLQGPMRNFALVTKAVADQKEGATAVE